MATLQAVASSSSTTSFYSADNNYVPPSPASIHSNRSAKSSKSSLSDYSADPEDEENATITGTKLSNGETSSTQTLSRQKSKSSEDIRILAISTHITELSYAISDIQTRIFEIQELRHKSQSQNAAGEASSPTSAENVTSIIDKSLMALDERLESVEKGIKSVNENMQPYLPPVTPKTATQDSVAATPTTATPPNEATVALLRKHTALLTEWESVQDESDVLREELKEDKWLTVFRTVTDQADGMMSSLEKAVTRCQDFIFQVHQHKRNGRHEGDDLFGSPSQGKAPITLDTFNTLLESYEAKKKHYMPATSKVLSIIDRGVRDRVTKNGETLRRHAESAQRWKALKERIGRTDAEMENVRRILLAADGGESEAGSSTSGYLATPPSGSRHLGSEKGSEKGNGALSRSISPFRKFARRITGSSSGGNPRISNPSAIITPLSVNKKLPKTPSSEPHPPSSSNSNFGTFRKPRTSTITGAKGSEPVTPNRPNHMKSQSVTPDPSPNYSRGGDLTRSYFGTTASSAAKSRPSLTAALTPGKPTWNASTKVDNSDEKGGPGTIRGTPSRMNSRPPSSQGMYASHSGGNIPPVPPLISSTSTPGRRSVSRASMASSRPWSPIDSSSSSQHPPPLSFSSTASSSRFNTPSRAGSRPPSRAQTPSRSTSLNYGTAVTPRQRPKTPSHIPMPNSPGGRSASVGTKSDIFTVGMSAADWSPESSSTRPFSPAFSTSGMSATGGAHHPPRPPSRSMIPVPSVHVSGASPGRRSRPSSSMSHIGHGYSYSGRAGSESPTMRMLSSQLGGMNVSPFKSNARRAQTPDGGFMMRSVSAATGGANASGTGTMAARPPPSSFRDNGSTPGGSRPSSRLGGGGASSLDLTHNMSSAHLTGPLHEYVAANPKDPLDMEVARVANGIPHGLVIERVDPPLKKAPKDGEEVKAQYSFSNALATKVVTCRLTTMTRATKIKAGQEEGLVKDTVRMVTTKKVMCRVGGGWQDLSLYILNRQAGL